MRATRAARLTCIALWLIALILAADFAITHLWPRIAMASREDDYFAAAKTCHEALSNLQDIETSHDALAPTQARLLRQSGLTSAMDCFEREALRRSLLSQGVNEHELDRLDLMARLASRSSLPYIVDGVRAE